MPPKSSKCDELIEALTDPRVIIALTKALGVVIAAAVDDALSKKLAPLRAIVDKLTAQNLELRTALDEQCVRIDEIECYSRRENIIIQGLPESSAAERASAGPRADDRAALG